MGSSSTARTTALRRAAIGGLAVAGVLAAGVAVATGGDGESEHHGAAVAELRDASGVVGTARFVARSNGLLRVKVEVSGLTPGFHGMHVHAVGQCVAPFTTAGGHHNPTGQAHGAHAGDLPPLLVRGDGTANARFEIDTLTLAGVLDAGSDGSALIIHGGRDNLANIPAHYSHAPDAAGTTGPNVATLATGDSGPRVVCGVVQRARGDHDD